MGFGWNLVDKQNDTTVYQPCLKLLASICIKLFAIIGAIKQDISLNKYLMIVKFSNK
jgi:hypothetical protein